MPVNVNDFLEFFVTPWGGGTRNSKENVQDFCPSLYLSFDCSKVAANFSLQKSGAGLVLIPVQFFFQAWDRSHTLENLSGQETDCSMLAQEQWSFTRAQTYV